LVSFLMFLSEDFLFVMGLRNSTTSLNKTRGCYTRFVEKRLKLFIEKLSEVKVPLNACNMFDYTSAGNEIRRNNLFIAGLAQHLS